MQKDEPTSGIPFITHSELVNSSVNITDPTNSMENIADSHRTLLLISIWAEMIPGKQPAWRGSIRTVDGQRMNFSTLADMNCRLCELSGWQDPLAGSIKDTRQTNP